MIPFKRSTLRWYRKQQMLGWLLVLLLTQVLYAQQNPHGDLLIDCQVCHTTTGWTEMRKESAFNHTDQTKFPLVGKHAGLRCAECHSTLVFKDADTQCLDCHTDVHRGQFSNNCAQCHTPKEWVDQTKFEQMHSATRFPLVGLHKNLDCQACHANGQYVNLPIDCQGCHLTQFEVTTEPNHKLAGFSTNCQDCHSIEIPEWKQPSFEHTQSFPLTGGHALSNCRACHANGYQSTTSACFSCHEADFNATQNPHHGSPAFSASCEECHTTTSWHPADFTHHDQTVFPLTGAHVQTACAQCHVGGQFADMPTACVACHESNYQNAVDPAHTPELFPNSCEQCHTTTAWANASFNNHDQTAFPLTGAHVQVNCLECHAAGFTGTPTECWSCHQSDFEGTTDPNHVQDQFPQDCAQCHSTTNWTDATFDHSATEFPLTGAHMQTDCAQCHVGGQYANTPTDCWSCHQNDYSATTDPNHTENQYPQNCTACHSTVNWTETTFDHNVTQFPLTGAHVQTNCLGCHANGYTGTPTECWSCHQQDYNEADDHLSQGYPHDCAMCHNTSDWGDANFDHNNTQFPLTGRHVQTNCAECHAGGVYEGTPTECWSCHQQDYNEAEDHLSQGYPHDCAMCHNTSDWEDANFDHNNTQFPLTGRHVQTNCAECHAGGVYEGTPTECWSCHQQDYNEAEDHLSQGYPHDCAMCHNTSDWEDANFDHNNTQFPLTGRHVQTNCAECHAGGVYEGTPTECWSCHQQDYNEAEDHLSQGYPHDCAMCHNTNGWEDNHFSHDLTDFPLLGAHAEVNCLDCHVGGDYGPLSMECNSCHQADADNATNPDHQAAGFGSNCAACHGFSTWSDGIYDHTRTQFPLTGAHVELACVQCHTVSPYGATPTACAECHQADADQAADPNHGSSPFQTGCADCHNTASWQNANFDHALAQFPLTGAHVSIACAQCHSSGYTGTPDQCVDCHIAEFNGTTNPNHVESSFSQACSECHNTTTWADASFDHNLSEFPLTGAHTMVECLQCHVGGQYSGTPQECIGCHETEFTSTTEPNHGDAGFSSNCTECHTTATWSSTSFDHASTGFPLSGAHLSPTCTQCHDSGPYSTTSSECVSCHLADYNGAAEPNHATQGYPTNCALCHTVTEWTLAAFDHNQSDFPLTGAHVSANCVSCHGGGVYNGLATECASCHIEDYNNANDPNHANAGFGTNCTECHSTGNWQAEFDHSQTGFPLTGAHISPTCGQCHTGGPFSETSSDCQTCHLADYNGAQEPVHAGQFPVACADCHNTVAWGQSTFTHDQTGFPLTGAHVQANCAQCHAGGIFAGTDAACFSCHAADYIGTDDPDHTQAGFSTECLLCHTTVNWDGAVFDHSQTGFPLTGAHMQLNCAQCHANGYTDTPDECVSCHIAEYTNAANPEHDLPTFSHNCTACHNTNSWQGASFDHNLSDFPLTGAHVAVSCFDCHVGGQYSGVSTQCVSCHNDDFANATEPNHGDAGFSVACQQCHNTQNWNSTTFNHSSTGFPLTGAHVARACTECHDTGPYSTQTSECVSCHQSNYNDAVNPNHAALGYPTDCQQCHGTASWQGASFDHNSTDFPLTGAHVATNCIQCHVGGVYNGLSTACAECHQTDYTETDDPRHADAGFSTTCNECHTTSNWNTTYDHSQTGFPLTGAHVGRLCIECHNTGPFSNQSSECLTCHQADYDGTTDPDHSALGYPTTCQQCHSTASWDGASFDHTQTDFPLTGAHVSLACVQCHSGGVYNGLSTACADCHQADYNGTSNPNHGDAGFNTQCNSCHTTTNWNAEYDHSQTGFPLTGAHLGRACIECHNTGPFSNQSSECLTCHQADYDGTTDPDHSALGYPTTCQQCHSTSSWDGANFDHTQTDFPLTGAHISLACVQCHSGGVYNGLSTACADCHQADYNGTSNPDHGNAGFSTQCNSCHTTTNWNAEYDHSQTGFPLTGAHLGRACIECHNTGPFSNQSSECVTCHQADYDGTTDPDHSVLGYPTTCQQCHSTSSWDGANFDHTQTDFPLTGAHISLACVQCHSGGVYNGLSTACVDCHQADFNGTSNPNHGDAGFNTQCNSCHTTTNWNAEYDHSQTGFPLTGAHVGRSCIECHNTGPFSNQSSECLTCHQTEYTGTTDPDHEALGFPTTCQQCHSTSSWDGASFDHTATGFPLTGAHVSVNCIQCHIGGQYSGTPTDCFFCHDTDYNNAVPDHNDGYPQSCQECHTTSNWSSTFNHDTQFFPIYTGRHRNEWNLCIECHTTSGVFTTFNCIECHEHANQSNVDDHHEGVNNYVYSPTSCYTCHPDGRADDVRSPGGSDVPTERIQRHGGGKP